MDLLKKNFHNNIDHNALNKPILNRKKNLSIGKSNNDDYGLETLKIEKYYRGTNTNITAIPDDELNKINTTSEDFKNSFSSYKNTISIISFIFLIIYIVLLVLIVIFGALIETKTIAPKETFKGTIALFSSKIISSSNILISDFNPIIFGDYSIWFVSIAIAFISSIFLIYPITESPPTFLFTKPSERINNSRYYNEILLLGGNLYMWVDFAITGSSILWIVAQYSGITDLLLLIIVVFLDVLFSFGGNFTSELVNNGLTFTRIINVNETKENVSTKENKDESDSFKNVETNWLPFIFGNIIPTLLLGSIYFTFMTYSQKYSLTTKPLIINWILLSILAIFRLALSGASLFHFASLSSDKDQVKLLNRNGQYEITKLLIIGLLKIFILITLFVELFLSS